MPLAPGNRVGPYEVEGRLGSGGMGEVYRATDTRLRRPVAIKVLPDSVARDASRLARFEREARALAALNHPNIASVHGLEDLDGSTALVMELIDGRTLADVVSCGPVKVDDALAMGRQIADALEAAHEQGIVHRDLKPANIIVRPDGLVKLLDFGLAKVVDPAGPSEHATMTAAGATEAGAVIGTPAYMSPEQARAESVDRRTDIWSFGCVLFEMLIGRSVFGRASSSDALAAVLTGPIDWTSLPSDLPPAVEALLARCLERDQRRRLRDIGEARVVLDDPASAWAPTTPGSSAGRASARRGATGPWLAAFGLVVGGLLGWWLSPAPVDTTTRSETSMLLPDDMSFAAPGRRYLAISPDGLQVAFTADPGLLVREVGSRDARVVGGPPEDSRSPFFAPDSQSIGYWADGALWRVAAAGGAPLRLADAVTPWSATWHENGYIYYGQGPAGIWKVDQAGGDAERVFSVEAGESAHGPQLLPGDEWVLFTLLPAGVTTWDRARIVAQSLATGDREILIDAGRDGRYLPTGHLIYALDGDLRAVTLDVDSLRVGETTITVVEGVADAGSVTGAVQFDVADAGSLIFAPSVGASNELQLTWVEPNGLETVLPSEARALRHPRVAPDGPAIIAGVQEAGGVSLWLGDRIRGLVTPLQLEGSVNSHPEWSPGGDRVAFFSSRDAGGLFTMSPTSPAGAELAILDPDVRPTSWTPEGQVLFDEFEGGEARLVAPLAPEGEVTSLMLVPAASYLDVLQASISPNGRWVAYHSLESGRTKIYVRPFPDVGRTYYTITSDVGISPVWARDGSALFFLGGRIGYRTRTAHMPYGSLMKVEVTESGSELSWTAPTPLFSLHGYVFPDISSRHYDVADDGRFLMLKDVSGNVRTPNQIVLIQNWRGDLVRRIPSR